MLDTVARAPDRKELRKALAALGFDADLPATRAALAQYDKTSVARSTSSSSSFAAGLRDRCRERAAAATASVEPPPRLQCARRSSASRSSPLKTARMLSYAGEMS